VSRRQFGRQCGVKVKKFTFTGKEKFYINKNKFYLSLSPLDPSLPLWVSSSSPRGYSSSNWASDWW
jgi:hypothetical protein